MKNIARCPWAGNDPLYCKYHDEEWGVPVHDDRKLFEFLVLEGFQAGLSWITILRKRENFRRAFCDWDWKKVSKFDAKNIKKLLNDKGIIRNRLKIQSAITNAARFQDIINEFGSFDQYIWQFTGHKTLRLSPRPANWKKIPCRSKQSDTMSKDLMKRGFRFVGTVICYSFMQAVGMVDDHVAGCWKSEKY
jgi:DNA-3-methyladenine glycosylase I